MKSWKGLSTPQWSQGYQEHKYVGLVPEVSSYAGTLILPVLFI